MKDENREMTEKRRKDILLAGYVVSVVFMAVIYFTVPERKDFIEFQFKWWREFIETLGSFF